MVRSQLIYSRLIRAQPSNRVDTCIFSRPLLGHVWGLNLRNVGDNIGGVAFPKSLSFQGGALIIVDQGRFRDWSIKLSDSVNSVPSNLGSVSRLATHCQSGTRILQLSGRMSETEMVAG